MVIRRGVPMEVFLAVEVALGFGFDARAVLHLARAGPIAADGDFLAGFLLLEGVVVDEVGLRGDLRDDVELIVEAAVDDVFAVFDDRVDFILVPDDALLAEGAEVGDDLGGGRQINALFQIDVHLDLGEAGGDDMLFGGLVALFEVLIDGGARHSLAGIVEPALVGPGGEAGFIGVLGNLLRGAVGSVVVIVLPGFRGPGRPFDRQPRRFPIEDALPISFLHFGEGGDEVGHLGGLPLDGSQISPWGLEGGGMVGVAAVGVRLIGVAVGGLDDPHRAVIVIMDAVHDVK